jgi:hypothetical protein
MSFSRVRVGWQGALLLAVVGAACGVSPVEIAFAPPEGAKYSLAEKSIATIELPPVPPLVVTISGKSSVEVRRESNRGTARSICSRLR